MNDPAWVQAYAALGQITVGLLQTLLIAWGLWQMRVSSQERSRQLDHMAAAQSAQNKALADVGRGIQELLSRERPRPRVPA